MNEPASEHIPTDNEECIEKILEKSGKQIDAFFSRYKYHVIKSALRTGGLRELSLLEDVRNKNGQLILAKGTAQTEISLRKYIGKLLQHDLEYPIEYYLADIEPESVEKIHAEMNQIAEALSQKGFCDFKNIKEIINLCI